MPVKTRLRARMKIVAKAIVLGMTALVIVAMFITGLAGLTGHALFAQAPSSHTLTFSTDTHCPTSSAGQVLICSVTLTLDTEPRTHQTSYSWKALSKTPGVKITPSSGVLISGKPTTFVVSMPASICSTVVNISTSNSAVSSQVKIGSYTCATPTAQ